MKPLALLKIFTARIDIMLAHNRRHEIHKISKSSFIIGMVDDATISYYFAEDLHSAIPGSEMQLFEDGGHYSYRRHPKKWNETIEKFVSFAELKV